MSIVMQDALIYGVFTGFFVLGLALTICVLWLVINIGADLINYIRGKQRVRQCRKGPWPNV